MQNMILAVGPTTPAKLCWSDENEEASRHVLDWEYVSETDNDTMSEDIRTTIHDAMDDDSSFSSRESIHLQPPRAEHRRQLNRQNSPMRPSIRHGGCINTACWLTSPWKFSLQDEGIRTSTTEVTTQIITSGDDQYLKIWDVSQAMGATSPTSGGWDTVTPFADNGETHQANKKAYNDAYHTFQARYGEVEPHRRPGSVSLVGSMYTGHFGNVFHASPIDGKPGKILTCAADGYLRLNDFQAGTATVVVKPSDEERSRIRYLEGQVGMAYSHEMLSNETGLLCSDYGLHRFDLRVPPKDQQRRSLLESRKQSTNRYDMCKCCAVWHPNGKSATSESTYVFAGGANRVFGLYDLRMDGLGTKTVQLYHPRSMDRDSKFTISGLDISKDGREILASYESDQIYTYPILPQASSSKACVTIDDIDKACRDVNIQTESRLYAGHLNRFTFLKVAKYAGPNDDYICTGSDSGHAWIFERDSGGVAALLRADKSICNGVIPHPTLPFFVTYGIQHTAKLWRATLPVDRRADDSMEGRIRTYLKEPRVASPPTDEWNKVQKLVSRYSDHNVVYPDYMVSEMELPERNLSRKHSHGIHGDKSPLIGNALKHLPLLLRLNRFDVYHSSHYEETKPVQLNLTRYSRRIASIRMQYQADHLGLQWHPAYPWKICGPETNLLHPCDLVPDNPSDWIPYHPWMTNEANRRSSSGGVSNYCDMTSRNDRELPWLTPKQQTVNAQQDLNSFWPTVAIQSEPESNLIKHQDASLAKKVLYETALLCKEGGNAAKNDGNLDLAARRYDKAIQYCAVIYMSNATQMTSELDHLTRGHVFIAKPQKEAGSPERAIVNWSPLLRVLVTTRLNLSLLFMNSCMLNAQAAEDQAWIAIELLQPFVFQRGKVMVSREVRPLVLREDVPSETYDEAIRFMIKAYFRQGSAKLHQQNLDGAVSSLGTAVALAKEAGTKPDPLLHRRLQEAKQKLSVKRKRTRKKFERMMRYDVNEDEFVDE